ncbi:MAG: D-hexose-6-phosphate mutarotase [Paucimonas sp.]|jgi:glucose-6-phosphate 1-epimerase|nr:D-hexose-6-phosphate mutarotase [Paucimonas sp.]
MEKIVNRRIWNGIWVTELVGADGSTALVADRGAHVLSWKPAGGEEVLYLSPLSKMGKGEPIRGGVPIIFPQFNRRGSGIRHGFARLLDWTPLFAGFEANEAVSRHELSQADAAGFGWAQAFTAQYEVRLRETALEMALTVVNRSDDALRFTVALHTYLRVSDIAAVCVEGLQHAAYTDCTAGEKRCTLDTAYLERPEGIDYIFADVPADLTLHDGTRTVVSSQHGFRDAVLWNPGAEVSRTLVDLEPDGHRLFICMEAAQVEQPVILEPGQVWCGRQKLGMHKALSPGVP